MAFKNVIRVRAGLSGMSDCILHLPQVYLKDLKNSYVGTMFEHRSDLVPSTRKKLLFQITFGRPGTRVSTKIHCDFHKNTLWRQWRHLPALGRLRRFQDHSRGWRGDRCWPPHPRQQLFPLRFLMGTVQIIYCTVVTKNEVQAPHGAEEHEKNHLHHPPDQKK